MKARKTGQDDLSLGPARRPAGRPALVRQVRRSPPGQRAVGSQFFGPDPARQRNGFWAMVISGVERTGPTGGAGVQLGATRTTSAET
jgi:hypothetical protein